MILNRVLCLLVPFDELRKGNASSGTTIEATYSSLPPQLSAWKAFRSGHFLLGAVSFIAVSTNILSVSLSGLVIERSTTTTYPLIGSQNLVPQFNGAPIWANNFGVDYFDHLYAAMANITEDAPLPAWVDSNNFYIPFEFSTPPSGTSSGTALRLQGIRSPTVGFGADLTCNELSADPTAKDTFIFELSQTATSTSVHFLTSHVLSDGSRIFCVPDIRNPTGGQTITTNTVPIGPSAIEMMVTMAAMENASDVLSSDPCSAFYVAGWARANLNTETSLGIIETNKTFIACTSNLLVADFNTSIDMNGRIINSYQTSDYSLDTARYFTNGLNETIFLNNIKQFQFPFSATGFSWHNDSFTSDWINSLIGYQANSNALVNPAFPVPDAATATANLRTLYRQLFALLIGLNSDHIFTKISQPNVVSVTAVFAETRLFISPLMLKITLPLLAIHLAGAILYYTNRPKRFLPRMPTSIASILQYVVASRASEDFSVPKNEVRELETRYGYGRYVGTDGRTHIGIEQQRFVIPLESCMPGAKRRRWISRGRRNEAELKNWI